MKQFASVLAGVIGFIANVLTLATFALTLNGQSPSISTLTKDDWAIWTALLSIYTVSAISASLMNARQQRNPERLNSAESELNLFAFIHIPFSIPIFLLWSRAFVSIPTITAAGGLMNDFFFLAFIYLLGVEIVVPAMTVLLFWIFYT